MHWRVWILDFGFGFGIWGRRTEEHCSNWKDARRRPCTFGLGPTRHPTSTVHTGVTVSTLRRVMRGAGPLACSQADTISADAFQPSFCSSSTVAKFRAYARVNCCVTSVSPVNSLALCLLDAYMRLFSHSTLSFRSRDSSKTLKGTQSCDRATNASPSRLLSCLQRRCLRTPRYARTSSPLAYPYPMAPTATAPLSKRCDSFYPSCP